MQTYYGDSFEFSNIDDFCREIFENNWSNWTFIAHNLKGFDGNFILEWLIKNNIKPETIFNGSKIMSLQAKGRRFIDSINFFQLPLANFPKTFGLKEAKTGYFPHLFKTPKNQNYIGPIPPAKYYGYKTMKKDAAKKFKDWHYQQKKSKVEFNFQKELLEYCRSDVDILRRSMIEFRREFIDLENIDPLNSICYNCKCLYSYLPSKLSQTKNSCNK